MDVFWFGDSWSSRGPQLSEAERVDIPVGQQCIECSVRLTERDRGVVTECSPRVWRSFWLDLGGVELSACCYHAKCWFRFVEAGEVSGEQLARSHGAMKRTKGARVEQGEVVHEESHSISAGDDSEIAIPGHGWGSK